MNIFSEGELSQYVNQRRDKIKAEVHAENENSLLNCNESQYVDYLTAKYRIDPVVLDFDQVTVSQSEQQIEAERFPGYRTVFGFQRGKTYLKQVISYYVPYSGDRNLLRLRPSQWYDWTAKVDDTGSSVRFDVVNFHDNPEEIKRQADDTLRWMKEQYRFLAAEVDHVNLQWQSIAKSAVSARKLELLKRRQILGSLGVPIRETSSVPSTFSVPIVPKPAIIKPSAPSTAYAPEPALDQNVYGKILQVLYDFGVNMEQHPSIYLGKDEESLRDLLLGVLAPHFQSVSGETFNKAGKTDILIRHERANVFVAECKFWKGLKGYHATINQALSYLTWRDSKAAVICFIRAKQLNPILQEIGDRTTDHPYCVKDRGSPRQGWYEYEFHLPDDETRSVHLTILCFHLPPAAAEKAAD